VPFRIAGLSEPLFEGLSGGAREYAYSETGRKLSEMIRLNAQAGRDDFEKT
jgi:hypothetical protein